MIELYQVHKVYDNNAPALVNIDLKIKKGDFVFITGPSGAGKTTLINILSGLLPPTSGQVFINNVDLYFESRFNELFYC